jgi:hypothetical protein
MVEPNVVVMSTQRMHGIVHHELGVKTYQTMERPVNARLSSQITIDKHRMPNLYCMVSHRVG